MKIEDLWMRIYAGLTRSERAAIADLQWQDRMRIRFGTDAGAVIERADELSLTTPLPRGEARAQAEYEKYVAELRSFAADSRTDGGSDQPGAGSDRA